MKKNVLITVKTDIDYIYAGENLVALRKTTENQVAIYFVYSDNLGSILMLD